MAQKLAQMRNYRPSPNRVRVAKAPKKHAVNSLQSWSPTANQLLPDLPGEVRQKCIHFIGHFTKPDRK
jgi:hypothetical protein